jgi:hypothetical protein
MLITQRRLLYSLEEKQIDAQVQVVQRYDLKKIVSEDVRTYTYLEPHHIAQIFVSLFLRHHPRALALVCVQMVAVALFSNCCFAVAFFSTIRTTNGDSNRNIPMSFHAACVPLPGTETYMLHPSKTKCEKN